MKKIDRNKVLIEAQNHLKYLNTQIGKQGVNQIVLKEQIENTSSLINAIKNNEMLFN